MNEKKKESNKENKRMEDNIEDELEKQWEIQDQVHKTCKMKGNAEERQKKWKEKYS
ncbi:MAG: hypothetical protein HWN80_15570 [Candidatus Lokiarchaeota archaeon]|nr:hypothetical protein [Candidatus Lokiarchaeota archaeon]